MKPINLGFLTNSKHVERVEQDLEQHKLTLCPLEHTHPLQDSIRSSLGNSLVMRKGGGCLETQISRFDLLRQKNLMIKEYYK